MLLGKDLVGNPVISIKDGRAIGKVQDLYLAADLKSITGVYLGSEGLLSRTHFFVNSDDVVVLGTDAVLVEQGDVVHKEGDVDKVQNWLRRDEFQGRPVDTPGGTKVGKIGDIVLKKNGEVQGFSLSRVYVQGPVAENQAVALHAMLDTGNEDDALTINLEKAEQQRLTLE